jgi:hypothetical protein
MNCPPEVAEIILAILRTGLARIRALAWSGESGRCAVEADHLHNLPVLLANYSPDLLRFYWDVERMSFVNESQKQDVVAFEEHWKRLASLVPAEAVPSLAS